MIIQSIKEGLKKVFINWKVFLFYYIFIMLISLILILPILTALILEMSYSLKVNDLLKKIDPYYFFEVFTNNSYYLSVFFPLVILLSLIYLIYLLVSSGGALSIYSENKNSLKDFFYAGIEYFPAILRGFLLTLAFYILPIIIILSLFKFRWTYLYERGAEKAYFVTQIFGLILLIFLFNFSSMIFDYLRIDLIVEKHKKARKALLNSLLFIFGNLKKTLLLFYAISILQLIVLFLLWEIEKVSNKIAFILAVIVVQISIIIRIIGKLMKLAAQQSLYLKMRENISLER